MLPVHFISDKSPLTGSDAVAALIVSEDGRYLLQLRDDKPGIWYPGHWSCFGGAVNDGERPLDALRRELEEELEFAGAECNEFTRFYFDLQRINGRKLYRIYYEVPVRSAALFRFVLHEGRDMRLFSPAEIFDRANLTPYDSFALWLHASRGRIR